MNVDFVSAGLGALLWELIKQLLGAILRRFGDQKSAKRKQLSEQCDATKEKVGQCLQQAVEYLTAECSEDRKSELGRAIRHELSLLGQSVKELNLYASELKVEAVRNPLLVSFRRALTWHLDSKSYKPQSHESTDVVRAYRTAFDLQNALTLMQISAA